MKVIQSTNRHLMDIMFLLRRCVEDMNKRDMFNWNNAYPSPAMIMDDILAGNLYMYLDKGICKGIIVLNDSLSKEYNDIDWKNKEGRILCVHRLAVNPLFQGRGIGRLLMEFAIKHALESGYSAILLDVIETNQAANNLYTGMGFQERGSFHFPYQKSAFTCYELDIK